MTKKEQNAAVLDRGQANFQGSGGFEANAKDLTLRGQGFQKLSSRPPPLIICVLVISCKTSSYEFEYFN